MSYGTGTAQNFPLITWVTCWTLALMTFSSGLVLIFPQLSFIAAHGKFRKSASKSTISSRWQQVPKSYFQHMYAVGISITSIFLIMAHANSLDNGDLEFSFLSYLFERIENLLQLMWDGRRFDAQTLSLASSVSLNSNRGNVHKILLSCFILHTARRYLECRYMTSYGNSTMHIGGYICGLFHYILVPVCLVIADNKFSTTSSTCIGLPYPILLFLVASYQQFVSHKKLYEIKNITIKAQNNSKNGANLGYRIPRGSMFDYVCCPHYFDEILIYLSFYLMSPASPSLLFLLIWVSSNLTVVSCFQLQWYKNEFSSTSGFPNNWKRIIPFVF